MATTAPLSPKMFTEALLSPSTQPDELAYIHMSVRRKMTVVEHINSFEITVKHAAYLLGADEEEVKRWCELYKAHLRKGLYATKVQKYRPAYCPKEYRPRKPYKPPVKNLLTEK